MKILDNEVSLDTLDQVIGGSGHPHHPPKHDSVYAWQWLTNFVHWIAFK
jgi:hypothetical protein